MLNIQTTKLIVFRTFRPSILSPTFVGVQAISYLFSLIYCLIVIYSLNFLIRNFCYASNNIVTTFDDMIESITIYILFFYLFIFLLNTSKKIFFYKACPLGHKGKEPPPPPPLPYCIILSMQILHVIPKNVEIYTKLRYANPSLNP